MSVNILLSQRIIIDALSHAYHSLQEIPLISLIDENEAN